MFSNRLILILVFVIAIGQSSFSQNNSFQTIGFQKKSIYIICRGTKQKLGFIAEKFNNTNKNVTHVGIGILENEHLSIYNVTNTEPEDTALVVENIAQFCNPEDLYYFAIWELKSTSHQVKKLKSVISKMASRKISFDMDFNEADNEKLYCSEFCAKVLMATDEKRFKFALREIELNDFYASSLNRKILRYYPVDFFESDVRFIKVFEKFF